MEYLKIVLRSDLCAGNGESAGNAIDTDVCMDQAGLPYIPARRLKGCLRQAALELAQMGYAGAEEKARKLFGHAYGNEGRLLIRDAVIKGAEAMRDFLTRKLPADGGIPDGVKRFAHPVNVEKIFSNVRGQTKLVDGVKEENTLRFTRVIHHYDPFGARPEEEMEFYAPVCLDTEDKNLRTFLTDCCRAMRHMGTSRNRGLGNVKVSLCEISEKHPKGAGKTAECLPRSGCVKISYSITLDAPLTLPGHDELNTSVPARSVIGCMADGYLRRGGSDDEIFRALFLNGKVRWSALTPVIHEKICAPAPMMLVKLKNDNGRMINHLAEKNGGWKTMKPKTLDTAFAALCQIPGTEKYRYVVAEPTVRTVYHYALNGTSQDPMLNPGTRTLYMQDSIEAGLVYGGTVLCEAEMVPYVLECLTKTDLRFGRSRSAQYAACSLKGRPSVESWEEKRISTVQGEAVYVVLKSDLALLKDGRYITEEGEVREILARQLGLSAALPQRCQDYCRYHVIGGYQATWQLQKPQVPVVRAGSVYCFEAKGGELPSVIQAGEFAQEGFGVCDIIPKEKMEKLSLVERGRIDCAEPEQDEEYIKNIYTMLLADAGIEALQRYALDYPAIDDGLPVGRLRCMLSEARDYKDLLRMIGTMKESDISSENEDGRKKISEKTVKEIYEELGSGQISLKKMLQHEHGLWEELEKYPEAEARLMQKWKMPLEILLHRQHYSKER